MILHFVMNIWVTDVYRKHSQKWIFSRKCKSSRLKHFQSGFHMTFNCFLLFWSADGHHAKTEVSIPNQNPIWNATISFDIGSGENLIDRSIEVALWDLIPQTDSVFLGECTVDLQKAFLDDRAVWYRLEDPKNLRAATLTKCSTSFNLSPRGSMTSMCHLGGDVTRFIRRNDYGFQRSISDDCDSIGESTSLLHPDAAWLGSSRRGSSQSETLEIETYQLGKDFSKSLPGSRRSSFQDPEKKSGEITPVNLNSRRRSSCIRKDPDEILRSLKAVRGELGRTMSLSRETEYNRSARRKFRRAAWLIDNDNIQF